MTFAQDPATGVDNKCIDVSKQPGNRVLLRTTVRMMTSDHMAGINTTLNPGALLLGWPGYTLGLGFLVRLADGNAAVQDCAGDFMWTGYAGNFFWAEPQEQLCAE